MIDPTHPRLSLVRQCALVAISRSSFYYAGTGETALNLALMRLIDAQFLETPYYGSRQMTRHLRRQGYGLSRKRIRRLMRTMGLTPIYQTPRTSTPHPGHRIYPYLLRDVPIHRPDHVWCADVTYIPMRRGFLYLVAIIELDASRRHAGLDRPVYNTSFTLTRASAWSAGRQLWADFGPTADLQRRSRTFSRTSTNLDFTQAARRPPACRYSHRRQAHAGRTTSSSSGSGEPSSKCTLICSVRSRNGLRQPRDGTRASRSWSAATTTTEPQEAGEHRTPRDAGG